MSGVGRTLNMLQMKQPANAFVASTIEPASLIASFDASKPRTGALDTRAYQELEPLNLPAKLRDRIGKAQRRAAAEKDGVSIFTESGASTLLLSDDKDPATAIPSNRTDDTKLTSHKGAQRRQDPQATAAGDTLPQIGPLKEKMHLPDVILGHKMREFEAKMNLNALFIDPLENNLHHLSIEDKEKVMLRMQEKIRAIMAEVDAHFVQVKNELDAHGVFDGAANYQRAQALCLVELQRRCKLEKLRDDAMREVLDENGCVVQSAMSQIEGKLNDLLAKKERRTENEQHHKAELAFNHLQMSTKNFALKRRPIVAKRKLSPVKKKAEIRESNQLSHDVSANDTRNEVPLSATNNIAACTATEDVVVENWATRHPHVAQVLQTLAANGGAKPQSNGLSDSLDAFSSRVATGGNSGDTNRAPSTGKLWTSAQEWGERSDSYKCIARRAFDDLLHRFTRWRWDSTSRFHGCSPTPLADSAIKLSPIFLQRLHIQRNTASARLKEEEEQLRQQKDRETNADRRKKADVLYQQLQGQIQTRRQEREEKVRSTNSGQTLAFDSVVPAVSVSRSAAKRAMISEPALAGLSRTGPRAQLALREPHSQGNHVLQSGSDLRLTTETKAATGSLTASLSAPVLNTNKSLAVSGELPLSRTQSRRAIQDLKLLGFSHHRNRRSKVRADSLIGAPVSTDLSTLGHFTNARIEERRASAQTWAWHHPQERARSVQTQSLIEEEGDDLSDVDASERRDAMGFEEGPEGNDNYGDSDVDSAIGDGESDDDWKSVRSSASSRHLIDSARSSFSAMSKKPGYPSPDDKGNRLANQRKRTKSPKRGGTHRTRNKSPSKRVNSAVRGPRGSRLLSRPSNSSNASGSSGGMFSSVHFTANAQVLQHRLEELWRALEFPFSAKLIMLEKYASVQDGDALAQALTNWEAAAEVVLLREKFKHIIAEYDELSELKPSSRLTPAEWSFLLMQQIELPVNAINLSSEELVHWTQENLDLITQRCEKTAQHLKAKTGDELCFQGLRYPPRA